MVNYDFDEGYENYSIFYCPNLNEKRQIIQINKRLINFKSIFCSFLQIFKPSQFQYYMAKRALPQRSTRGKLPLHLRDIPEPPQSIKNQPENQQERLRKQMSAKFKMNHLINLRKYPFGRSLHYFFDLDDLPRAPSTVSYVLNQQNLMKQTFSKDNKKIKESKIGDLLNRRLLGLPVNLSGQLPLRKQNRCKNVCYAYLFDIEDKKHNNDRIIYSIKILLKNINKLNISDINKLQFIKKDIDILDRLNQNPSMQQIKSILQNKLHSLITRKQSNAINWNFQDTVLFNHALNQKLHNQVVQLKNNLTQEYFQNLLEKHHDFLPSDIQNYIEHTTRYYQTDQPSITRIAINKWLQQLKSTILVSQIKNILQQNIPIVTMSFKQNCKLADYTEFLIGRRTFSMGQVHYYQAKGMIKKLFKNDLKLKCQKNSSYEAYYKIFRRRYQQIKKYKIKNQIRNYKYACLDQLVTSPMQEQQFNLFKVTERVQITKKEFIFLMIYFWLYQSLASIEPYINEFQDLLEIIGSDYFPKICNPLVEAFGTPMAGLIFYIFEALTELMSKINQLPNPKTRIFLQFCQKSQIRMIRRERVEQQRFSIERSLLNKKIKLY